MEPWGRTPRWGTGSNVTHKDQLTNNTMTSSKGVRESVLTLAIVPLVQTVISCGLSQAPRRVPSVRWLGQQHGESAGPPERGFVRIASPTWESRVWIVRYALAFIYLSPHLISVGSGLEPVPVSHYSTSPERVCTSVENTRAGLEWCAA